MESPLAVTLPDPNKQAFPLLSPQPGMIVYQSTPSPTSKTATGENINSHGKSGAIELPQIYDGHQAGIGEDVTNSTKDALKPSLPRVPAKQKGVSRESKTIQQTIEKAGFILMTDVKQSKPKKGFDGDDLPDDLTQRIHTNHPLPYQYKNFRSSIQMKTVPLTKRHRDLFASNKDQLIPSPLARTRVQPVHTRPFLWSQHDVAESNVSPTDTNTAKNPENLPDKFLAKEKLLKKMRGFKRRYSVPQHRKRFNDLHVGGQAPNLASRDDYRGEMTNLRNTVVPSEIQALYTGKGFNLPASHTSVRKREEWQANLKAEYALPNSAPAAVVLPTSTLMDDTDESARSQSADGDSTPHKPTTTHKTPKHKQTVKAIGVDHNMLGVGIDNRIENGVNDKGEVNRRVAGRGLHAKSDGKQTMKQPRVPKPKPRQEKKQMKDAGVLPKLQTDSPSSEINNDMEIMEHSSNSDRHGPSADISIDSPPEIVPPEEQSKEERTRPESEMEIEMTPDDAHNNLRIIYSPTTPKAVSPNPLKSADLTLNISEERRNQLSAAFRKLDNNQDGHISISELQTTLPDTLTRGQRMFIKEVYELVSSSTFFGMDEFVTVTCLCEEMLQLSEPLTAAYEEIDSSLLEQLMSQYVILFATVDRQQTGSISLDALKEILTMALDKDLNIHTHLYETILQTIDKEYSSAISKVEYLTFLPYFFCCR